MGRRFHIGFTRRYPWLEPQAHLHLQNVITMRPKIGREAVGPFVAVSTDQTRSTEVSFVFFMVYQKEN